MSTITLLIAVAFFVAAIIVGSTTENTWGNVAITWALLSVGALFFGLTLTF